MSYYFVSIGGTGGNVTLHPVSAPRHFDDLKQIAALEQFCKLRKETA